MTGKRTSAKYVLLLRGINVNPSTRVGMADLRELLADAGYPGARTLLQSGNVILDSSSTPDVPAIETAIADLTGVKSRIVALRVDEVARIAAANPLLGVSDDLSKMIITFVDGTIAPGEIERPSDGELAPERLVIAERAVYQWCPAGVLGSQLKPAWWKQFGPAVTARNVRTVNRILAAAAAS
ncbi:MAG TPA: DUF1697 domain-containing protein [Galbitalea sp.]|jgi:uncharacterized protein (DUF1697 family)